MSKDGPQAQDRARKSQPETLPGKSVVNTSPRMLQVSVRGTERISVTRCEPDLGPIPAPALLFLFLFHGHGGAVMSVLEGFYSFGQTQLRPTRAKTFFFSLEKFVEAFNDFLHDLFDDFRKCF